MKKFHLEVPNHKIYPFKVITCTYYHWKGKKREVEPRKVGIGQQTLWYVHVNTLNGYCLWFGTSKMELFHPFVCYSYGNQHGTFTRNITKHTHSWSEHLKGPYVNISITCAYTPAPGADATYSETMMNGSFTYNGSWFKDTFYKVTGCVEFGFHVLGKNEFGEFIMSLIRTNSMTHWQMSKTYASFTVPNRAGVNQNGVSRKKSQRPRKKPRWFNAGDMASHIKWTDCTPSGSPNTPPPSTPPEACEPNPTCSRCKQRKK